jgi:hypothetical protein
MKLPLYILLGALGTLSLHGQTATPEADAIKLLTKKIEEIETQRKADSARLDTLMGTADEEAKARYKLIRSELLNHIDLLRGLNDKLMTLDTKTASASLTNYIGGLQNPTSKELGFELKEVLTKAVDQLQLGAIRGPRTKRIVNAIMDSPLYKSVIGSNPVAAALGSVLELVRGIGFVDNTNTDRLDAFEREIGKYIAYYTVLNEATTGYSLDLKSQTIELSALHNKIRQQAVEFAGAMGCQIPEAGKDEATRDYLNKVFAKLDREAVETFLEKQEESFTDKGKDVVNHRSLLAPKKDNALLIASGVARSSADMVEQLQTRKKLWEEAQSSYCKKVDTALQLAYDTGIGNQDKIRKAKEELTRLRTADEATMGAALNLDALVKLSQSIKRPK